jgi:hypothetical protein
MAIYCDEIGADILQDCSNRPTAQLEQKVLIIPSSQLPASGITYDGTRPDSLITAIALSTGTGYLIEGILQKTWINHGNTYVNPADGTAGSIHMINGIKILDPSVEIRDEINNLAFGGGTVFAIVERKWKGTSSLDSFLFHGLKFGLVIPDGGLVDNSAENDGAMVITLQTPEGFKEPNIPHVFVDTDYATTQTAVWTNKLSA